MRIWPFFAVVVLAAGCGTQQPPPASTPQTTQNATPSPAAGWNTSLPPAPSPTPAPPGKPAAWRQVSLKGQAVASSGLAVFAADADPTTEWNPRDFITPDKPQWLSVQIMPQGDGPLALVWTGHGLHYQKYDYGHPRSYSLQVSEDSTDGRDGTWRTLKHVKDDPVRSGVDLFDAPKARWVRLSFEDAWASLMPEPFLREVRVYQAHDGSAPDTWIVMGDSVTSVAFDPQKPDAFAQAVSGRHPERTPIMISGGTGGDESGDSLARLDVALPTLPQGTVVGLLYGSNDASHGVSLADYRKNLQAAIDKIRAAGDLPLLAVLPWSLNGQIDAYAQVCRDLMASNQLPAGPDFYTYFKAHPDELEVDKVHPNATGIVTMQRMWADAAEFRYR